LVGNTYFATWDTFPNGQSAVFDLSVSVNNGVAPCTVITNTANVTSASLDPNLNNNSSTVNTVVGGPCADLQVTKTGPNTVTAGTNATYMVAVYNAGPNDAQNVVLTDTLPAGETFVSASEGTGSGTSYTDNIGTLASGATHTVTIVALVSPSVPNNTSLTNSATVTSSTQDQNAGNNTGSTTATVQTSADLLISKTGPATAMPGQTFTYTISVTNNGPSDAQNVSVTDTVPNSEPIQGASAPPGDSVSVSGQTVTFTEGTVPSGATETATITVRVNNDTPNGTVLSNTAQVTSSTADSNTGNNTSTANTTVTVPTITSCSASPTVLTPADNTMRSVTVTISSSGSYMLQSVTSDDPTMTAADYTFVPGTTYPASQTTVTGQLRAKVGAGLHARSYVLTFVPAGGPAGTSCQVSVQVRLR
jgi:uncharacterized repeat protein (TIGR01451 family)